MLLSCLLATLLTAPPAASRGRDLAIFPLLVQGKPDKQLVSIIEGTLMGVGERQRGVRIVPTAKLRARVRAPAQALRACGTDLVCVARLGARVGADEVLLGLASAEGAGVAVNVLVVETAKAKVVRKVKLVVTSASGAPEVVSEHAGEIFGVASLPPPVGAAPLVSKSPAPPAPLAEQQKPLTVSISLAHPPEPVRPPVEPSWREQWRTLRPWPQQLGVATGGVGAVMLALGGYFGARASALRGDITRDGSMTQLDAMDTNRRANDMAGRATVSLATGSALLAVGLAGVAVDWLAGDAGASP